jgi:uncharacterized SAM-binding protein YcdF (DUF218 family)
VHLFRSFKRFKYWKLSLFIFLFLCALDIIVSIIYYNYVTKFCESRSSFNSTDAGVVFFHGFGEIDGLSDESVRRVSHSIELYKENKIHNIVCVGGKRINKKQTGSQIMKNFIIQNNIPDSVVFNDSLSFDSISNWEESGKIIREKRWNSVTLVSTPLHLFRIKVLSEFDSTLNINLSPSVDYYDLHSLRNFLLLWSDIHEEWGVFFIRTILGKKIYRDFIYLYRNI